MDEFKIKLNYNKSIPAQIAAATGWPESDFRWFGSWNDTINEAFSLTQGCAENLRIQEEELQSSRETLNSSICDYVNNMKARQEKQRKENERIKRMVEEGVVEKRNV